MYQNNSFNTRLAVIYSDLDNITKTESIQNYAPRGQVYRKA